MTVSRSTATTISVFLIGLLQVTPIVSATAISDNTKEESIPTFSLSDLRRLSGADVAPDDGSNHRGDSFREALSTNGLMAIRLDDGGYSRDRNVALDGLCSCVDHPDFLKLDRTHELTLRGSSTTRTSVATATAGLDHPLPLPEGLEATCGNEVSDAMEGLRDTLATVSEAFASAVDRVVLGGASTNANPNSGQQHAAALHGSHRAATDTPKLLRDEFGKSYDSITGIVRAANHLEHFHVYTRNPSGEDSGNDVAWDWHTDAGLFLVFVPAWNCNGGGDEDDDNVDNSFYYRDTDGSSVRAKFESDRTAIVMLGQGAQDWLDLPKPSPKQPKSLLKATTHSVRWSEPLFQGPPNQRRSWYGMMNLVPETAIIYGGKTLRDVKKSLSLSRQHKNHHDLRSSGDATSLGCGSVPVAQDDEDASVEIEEIATTSRRRRHLQMQDAVMCNNVTNFYCWMTCVDIPKVDQAELYLEAGYSLYCMDDSVLRSSGSLATAQEACVDVHNMGCTGQWEKTDNSVPNAIIDITTTSDEIEAPFCYSGTTMYMEGFQWTQSSTCVIMLFPSWVLNSATKYVFAIIGTILASIGLEKFIQMRRKAMANMEAGSARLVASAVFYGIQLSIGYMLMLVIMIYSGALFLSVILGLVIGHILFNARDAIWPIKEPRLDEDDLEETRSNGSTSSKTGIEASMPKSSCCTTSTNLLAERALADERAIREGSTYCQEFESDKQYYGSMDKVDNHENVPHVVTSLKKSAPKKKTIHQDVPEGSTPCCQHGL
mmetsp:Transcript_27532/g.64596  ORF Transcript_27532/g.64596 Transcript_27532/m.64596 type:complete len:772 (-) Transcript_27532:186-2501(-)